LKTISMWPLPSPSQTIALLSSIEDMLYGLPRGSNSEPETIASFKNLYQHGTVSIFSGSVSYKRDKLCASSPLICVIDPPPPGRARKLPSSIKVRA
ncbi:hypothetical protein SK128_023424, partial [Halocaridina rubra]